MHRSLPKRSVPVLAIAITAVAALTAMIGSCVFETRTNFCEQFGVRCKEGQECAAHQAMCIDIGGLRRRHRGREQGRGLRRRQHRRWRDRRRRRVHPRRVQPRLQVEPAVREQHRRQGRGLRPRQ